MGQWIQDGERTIFETVLSVSKTCGVERRIPEDKDNPRRHQLYSGEAHRRSQQDGRTRHSRWPMWEGGVPNIRIELDRLDEYTLGQLYLLLREGLWHKRLYARRKSFPTSPEWKPIRRTCSDSLRNRVIPSESGIGGVDEGKWYRRLGFKPCETPLINDI